jgi:hypothetical protein
MGHRIMTALAAVALVATSATAAAEPPPRRAPATRPVAHGNPIAAALLHGREARVQAINPAPDLFPQDVLEAYAEPHASMPRPQQKKMEPRDTPSLALGDDRDWRVQAAQIAGMTGAFAALALLCADGGCMLP